MRIGPFVAGVAVGYFVVPWAIRYFTGLQQGG